MDTLLEAIGIVLETYFDLGSHQMPVLLEIASGSLKTTTDSSRESDSWLC